MLMEYLVHGISKKRYSTISLYSCVIVLLLFTALSCDKIPGAKGDVIKIPDNARFLVKNMLGEEVRMWDGELPDGWPSDVRLPKITYLQGGILESDGGRLQAKGLLEGSMDSAFKSIISTSNMPDASQLHNEYSGKADKIFSLWKCSDGRTITISIANTPSMPNHSAFIVIINADN